MGIKADSEVGKRYARNVGWFLLGTVLLVVVISEIGSCRMKRRGNIHSMFGR